MEEQGTFTINVQLSHFANMLRKLRHERGLTIRDVAVACDIRADRLMRYELDKEIPSMQTIMTLASFYGVEASELLKSE